MTAMTQPDSTGAKLVPADLAVLASAHLGVLITLKPDGRPQSSNVGYMYDDATRQVSISTTADRFKVANLRRDPRSSLHVIAADGWGWAAAEATAVLSPIAQEPDDAVVEELVTIYRTNAGEHPDWDDFRRAMVDDQRLVVRLELKRTYGSAPR
jgi:PPOX class probable F420-dependent enzyme